VSQPLKDDSETIASFIYGDMAFRALLAVAFKPKVYHIISGCKDNAKVLPRLS